MPLSKCTSGRFNYPIKHEDPCAIMAIDSMRAVLEYFRLDSRITFYRWEDILRDVEWLF